MPDCGERRPGVGCEAIAKPKDIQVLNVII